MRIGLLEDNASTAEYINMALKMAGHSVHSHTHGASLLELLFTAYINGGSLPYDLVIVDILLPGNLSGLEVINRIRQILPPEKLPLIVISAVAGQSELERIKRNFPSVEVLSKPFKLKTLIELIETNTVGNVH